MSTSERDDLEELLQPTVEAQPRSGKLPWRVHSQFWVAFFGGFPAAAGIAYYNLRRLGAPARARQLAILSGVVAALLMIAAFFFYSKTSRDLRIAGRIIAVVQYLALARLQRSYDHRHQLFGSGEYAPLWNAGLVAILAGAVVQFLVIAPLIMFFR